MIFSQNWGDGAQAALLLHCSLASSDAWRGMADHLLHDLTMTGIDFPGHGRSDDWDGQGDYHAQCTRAAETALLAPVHLIGHSLGATVALRLAVERPEMMKSLVLIEPVFFGALKGTDAFQDHLKEVAPFAQAFDESRPEDAARMFTGMWGTGANWEALPIAMRTSFVERIGLIPATEAALYDDNAGVFSEGRIEGIKCPVLLIEGTLSPSIISAVNGVLNARLPLATRMEIEGAGHMAPISHAGAVATKIAAFLASNQS